MARSKKEAGIAVAKSITEMAEIVMPNDANPLGNIMGGRVMHLIDICAAISAGRHSKGAVVTASIDQLDFLNPVAVGGILVLKASVNFCGRTSMEVGVKVWSEDRASGRRQHVASSYLTFVALDGATGRPRCIPVVVPRTHEQKRRYKEAKARRAARLASKKEQA